MNTVVASTGWGRADQLFANMLLGGQQAEVPVASYEDYGFKHLCSPLNFLGAGDLEGGYDTIPGGDAQFMDFNPWFQPGNCIEYTAAPLVMPNMTAAAEPSDIRGIYANNVSWPASEPSADINSSAFCKSKVQKPQMVLPMDEKLLEVQHNTPNVTGRTSAPCSEMLGQQTSFEYPFEGDGNLGVPFMMVQQETNHPGTSKPGFVSLDPMCTPYVVPQVKQSTHQSDMIQRGFCIPQCRKDDPLDNFLQQISQKSRLVGRSNSLDVIEPSPIPSVRDQGEDESDMQRKKDSDSILYRNSKKTRSSSQISRTQSERLPETQKASLLNQRQQHTQKSLQQETLSCPHEGCHKTFPKLYNLKSHLVCHSSDKPHSCTLCEKSFARKHDLQRHLRTIHSANRPFECEVCYEAFPRADALRRHKIVERGTNATVQKQKSYPSVKRKQIQDIADKSTGPAISLLQRKKRTRC